MGCTNITANNLQWLQKKATRMYGHGNELAILQKEKVRRIEGRILQFVLMHYKKGIGHILLAKLVGIDRKNLTPHINRLIEKKLIRREDGKRGRYFPTEEAYKDARLSAYLFGTNFIKLLGRDNLVTNNERRENIIPGGYCLDFTGYRHYFEPKFRENDRLEHCIFEFSNKVGSFITFVLIQALNPENKQIIKSEEHVENDTLIQEWIKGACLSIMPFLVSEFRDSLYKARGKYQSYNEYLKRLKRKPELALSKYESNEVERAFARIYPLLNYELDKMIKELSLNTESLKQFIDEMEEKWKTHETCKHEFGKSTYTLEGYGRQCTKCHYIEKLQKPISKRQKKKLE
jgi:hypothetical protein